MDSTTQFLAIAIIVLVLATNLIMTQIIRRRRRPVVLRAIPAYEAIPLLVGEAIEGDRPMHASFGGASLGDVETPLTIATAELVYRVAQLAAIGAVQPLVTMSDTTTIPLAQDTLRRAYASRGRLDSYNGSGVRWYPSGGKSLAFAAALSGMLGDSRVSGSVLAGIYGTELALILDAAARRDQATIATSVSLEGQAVAYAMSDRPLIGEEVFAAAAYLGGEPGHVATIATIDLLRGLLILLILLPTADVLTNGAVLAAFQRLLGGR